MDQPNLYIENVTEFLRREARSNKQPMEAPANGADCPCWPIFETEK